jgi:alpha-N-arabinofuranosidase
MNHIKIDPERTLGQIDRNIFGGFAEHLGRCIYGGIYEPGSPLADKDGFRTDTMKALKRLAMPIMRYPGGNFVSGYRWMDGVGPIKERKARMELAWHTTEPNTFGTNEFVTFCRKLGTEPYIAVNCGDGDMREARDWVEYCNGTTDSYLVNLRKKHGFKEPHKVKYWGLGNEVDGHWQIGYKTPQEYARTATEFGKVMKWVDPSIKLVASAVSAGWETPNLIECSQLIMEQAGNLIDYLGIHWYVGNRDNDFNKYMTIAEKLEKYLSGYEGLVKVMLLANKIQHPVYIAFDEWNVWYRARSPATTYAAKNLEERYNLEDAMLAGIFFNAFIRHASSVKMANIAQIVNVIAPIFTNKKELFLQTIFFPFELYSRTCGAIALDVLWQGETFSSGDQTGLRKLDVSATLDKTGKKVSLYVVNRSLKETEAQISLTEGEFTGRIEQSVVNGPDIKAENDFDTPDKVGTTVKVLKGKGKTLSCVFEPHSVTALVFNIS